MTALGWVKWDTEDGGKAPFFEGLAVSLGITDKVLSLPETTMVAPPVTNHFALVGTAFDYVARLHLARHHGAPPTYLSVGLVGKKVMSQPLVAESGIRGSKKRSQFFLEFKSRWFGVFGSTASLDPLLSDCIVLANMESVARSGIDPGDDAVFSVDSGDVADLRRLLSVFNLGFSSNRTCHLNPCFGESSSNIGGADADAIVGGSLIDFKATKRFHFKREYLYQLLAYYLLNLREGDPYKVKSLGVYFARHGYLHSFPVPAVAGRDEKGRAYPTTWEGCHDTVWDNIESYMSLYPEWEMLDDDLSNNDVGEWVDIQSAWTPGGDVFQSFSSKVALYQQLTALSDSMFAKVGHSFDPLSDVQVGCVLFDELSFPRRGRNKVITNGVLRGVTHPVAELIVQYRELCGKE